MHGMAISTRGIPISVVQSLMPDASLATPWHCYPCTLVPQSSLRQKEAVLTEAVSSHAAQLEMWRAEATEVAQAASKWKQRAMMQQQQVCRVLGADCRAGVWVRVGVIEPGLISGSWLFI